MDLKKSFNNFLEVFRENFSIIIAIPTILGGLWQVISLVLISPIFLRFFSLSQLISDGIFVALLIIVAIGIPYIVALSTSTLFIKSSSKVKLILSGFSILLLMVSTYLDLHEKKFNIFILMFYSYSMFQFYLFNFTVNYRAENFSKFDKFIMIFIILSGIYISIVSIFNVGSEFSRSYKNIENIKYIELKTHKKYPCARVEYFNDKYIFIEKDSVSSSKSFIIEKFDVLTETN